MQRHMLFDDANFLCFIARFFLRRRLPRLLSWTALWVAAEMARLLNQAAAGYAQQIRQHKSARVPGLARRMGWSDAEAAAQLRVDRARVFRWRKPQHAGGRAVPPYIERLCELLETLARQR